MSGSLELKHIISLQSNFLNPEFPGLREAAAVFESKVLAEAASKCSSLSSAAKVLKISKTSLHLKMKAANIRFKGDLP